MSGGIPQRISISGNPVIPGKRMVIPSSSDADPEAPEGSLRRNAATSRLQAHLGNAWRDVVTGGGVSVTGARSAGTGVEVLDRVTADGVIGIRSIRGSGAISAAASSGTIVISESLACANAGSGPGQVFKGRSGSDLQLRTIRAGAGLRVSTTGDEIEISSSADAMETTTQTTGSAPKTIMDSRSPPAGKVWFVEAVAVGRTDSSDFGAIKREFAARNEGGTISLAGTGANRVNFAAEGGTGNWDLLVSGGPALDFKVRGGLGQTVDWKISIRVIEI